MSFEGLELTPQLFVILSALVEERLGLHYGPDDRELFHAKVAARASEAGYESLLDYYYFLKYDDPDSAELRALTDALVVNETYLFREAGTLRVVVDEVLAPRVEKHGEARVWSAACATGEEPLTLAMLLSDRGLLDRVRIHATDVSERALSRARQGLLGRRSVRDPAIEQVVARWTEPGGRIARALVDAITFERLNLLDARDVQRLPGPFDVVLLRNVLIYFSDATIRRVLAHVDTVLAPNGIVVVGASESLLRLGVALTLHQHGDVFLYRKAGAP